MRSSSHWQVTRSPAAGLALCAIAATVVTAQQGFLNSPAQTKYAAIGLPGGALPAGGGLTRAIGEGDAGNLSPLMVQDKLWEPRCDNAYPNVIHSPGDPNGEWRLWYGCMTSGTKFATSQGAGRTNAWLYANSSDGKTWTKPSLGLYDLATGPEGHNKALPPAYRAALQAVGSANNIVMGSSDGMGITLDPSEKNLSRKFKAFGTAEPNQGGGGGGAGVFSSADGLVWPTVGYHTVSFSKQPDCVAPACPAGKQRYDDHQQPLWDAPTRQYVLTTRTYPNMRAIAFARTPSWPPTGEEQVTQVEVGDGEHQLYSQVTFRFYDIWLGMVMVFDTADASKIGTVHTRLSWSPDGLANWSWVDPGGLLGKSFIPLGPEGTFASHIIFAADAPIPVNDTIRVYYMGGNGPHNGPRNTSLGMMKLRMDGFAGLRGSGTVTTRSILCTGPHLRLTADVEIGGSVRVGMVAGAAGAGLGLPEATPIMASVTDGVVVFKSGKTFAGLVGKSVTLTIEIKDATLFTVSFFSD